MWLANCRCFVFLCFVVQNKKKNIYAISGTKIKGKKRLPMIFVRSIWLLFTLFVVSLRLVAASTKLSVHMYIDINWNGNPVLSRRLYYFKIIVITISFKQFLFVSFFVWFSIGWTSFYGCCCCCLKIEKKRLTFFYDKRALCVCVYEWFMFSVVHFKTDHNLLNYFLLWHRWRHQIRIECYSYR